MFGTRDSAPAPAYAAALEAISADPKLTLYVARSEGRVLGTFQLILMPVLPPWRDACHRGSGTCRSRCARARRRAHDDGVRHPQAFYEACGFERRHEGFKIDLDERP